MLTLKYKSSLFAVCLAAMVGMGMFSACGQDEIQDEISEPIDSASMPAQTGSWEKSEEAVASNEDSQVSEDPELAAMFGDNCITSQTFEVTMSEYDGKVWFVPYYPSKDEDTPFIEIIQNGEVRTPYPFRMSISTETRISY